MPPTISTPTGQEGQHADYWFKLIIGALPVAGFVVGYWTHILVIHREVRARRREFRLFIRRHVEQFELFDITVPGDGRLIKLYRSSVDDIAKASLDIVEDIPRWRRTRFTEARRAYTSLTYQDVETRKNQSENMAGPSIWVLDIAVGKKKLIGLLTEMIRYAR
jgi:hypothetical protein